MNTSCNFYKHDTQNRPPLRAMGQKQHNAKNSYIIPITSSALSIASKNTNLRLAKDFVHPSIHRSIISNLRSGGTYSCRSPSPDKVHRIEHFQQRDSMHLGCNTLGRAIPFFSSFFHPWRRLRHGLITVTLRKYAYANVCTACC